MELYDVFKSEGGFRVAGAVYNDCPVMDRSPWFETREEADEAAKEMRFRDATCNICIFEEYPGSWIILCGDVFYTAESKEKAIKIARTEIINMGFSSSDIEKYGIVMIFRGMNEKGDECNE